MTSKFLQIGSRSVPCTTPSECQLLELRANRFQHCSQCGAAAHDVNVTFVRCSYGRVALQTAYEALNVGVHVLGVVAFLACGCISSPGSEVICSMGNVPNGAFRISLTVVALSFV